HQGPGDQRVVQRGSSGPEEPEDGHALQAVVLRSRPAGPHPEQLGHHGLLRPRQGRANRAVLPDRRSRSRSHCSKGCGEEVQAEHRIAPPTRPRALLRGPHCHHSLAGFWPCPRQAPVADVASALLARGSQDHVLPPDSRVLLQKSCGGPLEAPELERTYRVATLDDDADEIERRAVEFAMSSCKSPATRERETANSCSVRGASHPRTGAMSAAIASAAARP